MQVIPIPAISTVCEFFAKQQHSMRASTWPSFSNKHVMATPGPHRPTIPPTVHATTPSLDSMLACRVLRVNYAQPMKIKGGEKGFSHQAVWADADRYLEERLAEAELDAHEREVAKAKEREAAALAEAEGDVRGSPEPPAAAEPAVVE